MAAGRNLASSLLPSATLDGRARTARTRVDVSARHNNLPVVIREGRYGEGRTGQGDAEAMRSTACAEE